MQNEIEYEHTPRIHTNTPRKKYQEKTENEQKKKGITGWNNSEQK